MSVPGAEHCRLSCHPWLHLVHETIHRVEKLTEIAIAVEVVLEGAYPRCFAVTRRRG
jgi:hypothetical protein